LALELYFSLFVIKSDGFGFTLSAKKWFSNYWIPINSFGYRDVEHSMKDFNGKKSILIVGDSFVAGHGIKNYRDRFSNLIQEKLHNQYVVLNIAKNGWNTNDEYKAIISNPFPKPFLVILSYFINDIEGAAKRCGMTRPELVIPPNETLKPLIDRSYFINYLYWRLYRFGNVNFGQIYWEYLKKCYNDKRVFDLHKEELNKIIQYTHNNDIYLLSIVFPNLMDIESSKPFTKKIVDFFQLNQVDFIDLTSVLSRRNSKEIIINNLDGHPNEKFSKELADMIYPKVVALEKVPSSAR
jgi:hypothetical protein